MLYLLTVSNVCFVQGQSKTWTNEILIYLFFDLLFFGHRNSIGLTGLYVREIIKVLLIKLKGFPKYLAAPANQGTG
ncbi:hypothetical protein C427_4713 [Paraglaciecola psychrophila 170]|jgi:hypothetical protein|uniref:Uncharacterized protein n=1 Tax=Paraglaciecola psychrophila 170 TaxID=1129794 RepID=K7AGY7_9ALTE|nr:hypothetical protein C427_4713 [Paraglaciecola psychrophila 170]GAC39863.1 hypothetical protein GPSY_4252 [Paraglaciecola psychrophila 170]